MQSVARSYSQRKVSTVETISELAKSHKVIMASRLNKVRAAQLMFLRRNFRSQLQILVAKNNIASLGLMKSGREGITDFVKNLQGQNALIFTDIDPFRLFIALEKNKVNLAARASDIATDDVIVGAGNTGLPPGPILSEFKEAGVPTRIDTGSIWVSKDTVILRKGEVFTPKVAGLLSRLGIKPIKAGLSISMAYLDGLLLYEKDVLINLAEYRSLIGEAQRLSIALSLAASYPTKESLPMQLAIGARNAYSVAVRAGYLAKDTALSIFSQAVSDGARLYTLAMEKGYK